MLEEKSGSASAVDKNDTREGNKERNK